MRALLKMRALCSVSELKLMMLSNSEHIQVQQGKVNLFKTETNLFNIFLFGTMEYTIHYVDATKRRRTQELGASSIDLFNGGSKKTVRCNACGQATILQVATIRCSTFKFQFRRALVLSVIEQRRVCKMNQFHTIAVETAKV